MAPKLKMLSSRVASAPPSRLHAKIPEGFAGAKSSSSLYGHAWRKLRARFLMGNPLCVHCLEKGLITPANEVDHIEPHRGDMEKFYDESNLQALCKPCHSRKTATEDHGFGNF